MVLIHNLEVLNSFNDPCLYHWSFLLRRCDALASPVKRFSGTLCFHSLWLWKVELRMCIFCWPLITQIHFFEILKDIWLILIGSVGQYQPVSQNFPNQTTGSSMHAAFSQYVPNPLLQSSYGTQFSRQSSYLSSVTEQFVNVNVNVVPSSFRKQSASAFQTRLVNKSLPQPTHLGHGSV